MKVAVVIPTNRENQIREMLAAFRDDFESYNVAIVVVEDNESKLFSLPSQVIHVSRKEMRAHLGDKTECIAIRGAAIRSYGWLLAQREVKPDVIVNLDDDVRPVERVNVIQGHLRALNTVWSLDWYDTVPFPMRGRPYDLRDYENMTMLNHGLWSGNPDLDAYQRLSDGEDRKWDWASESWRVNLVPRGQMFAMCGMNTAFRMACAPVMWQPKLPEGYRRWDDIWAGFVFKFVADICGWPVTSGAPFVQHSRASEVIGCLRQEMLGYGVNESLWKDFRRVRAEHISLCKYNHLPTPTKPTTAYSYAWTLIGDKYPMLAETAKYAAQWLSLWETVL